MGFCSRSVIIIPGHDTVSYQVIVFLILHQNPDRDRMIEACRRSAQRKRFSQRTTIHFSWTSIYTWPSPIPLNARYPPHLGHPSHRIPLAFRHTSTSSRAYGTSRYAWSQAGKLRPGKFGTLVSPNRVHLLGRPRNLHSPHMYNHILYHLLKPSLTMSRTMASFAYLEML